MYAVEIQVISWMLAPSSPRMFGRATLTIDESMVAISDPNAIDTATSHLLTGTGCDIGTAIALIASPSLARKYPRFSELDGSIGWSRSKRNCIRAFSEPKIIRAYSSALARSVGRRISVSSSVTDCMTSDLPRIFDVSDEIATRQNGRNASNTLATARI